MNQPSTKQHPAAAFNAPPPMASPPPRVGTPRHWIPELPMRPNPDFVADDDRVTGRMSNE
jgi:hypothetical protein